MEIYLSKVKEVDPTFKTIEYEFSLVVGSKSFALRGFVNLGLFEPNGWNHYSVESGILEVNHTPTDLMVDSRI
jgi:hypothetical protein